MINPKKGINTLRLHFDILKNFDNVKILSDDITSPLCTIKGFSWGSNKSYILYSITVPVVKLNLKVVCFITFMLLFLKRMEMIFWLLKIQKILT